MCSSTSPSSMAVVQHMMAWQTWSQMVHLGAPEAACWQDTHITQENTVMFCFRFRHADQTPSLGPRLYKYHWYALWVSGRFFIKLSLSFFLSFFLVLRAVDMQWIYSSCEWSLAFPNCFERAKIRSAKHMPQHAAKRKQNSSSMQYILKAWHTDECISTFSYPQDWKSYIFELCWFFWRAILNTSRVLCKIQRCW